MSGTVLLGSNQRPERVSIPIFISFKKGHTSDIRPTTLSSWFKQTILLCYKQADQLALDLVQVKAHDIRALADSKPFCGGVSVDQIMQACHWKAHNTFTNYVHPPGGWIYYFCFFRRPMSGVRCPASRMVSAHLKEKY